MRLWKCFLVLVFSMPCLAPAQGLDLRRFDCVTPNRELHGWSSIPYGLNAPEPKTVATVKPGERLLVLDMIEVAQIASPIFYALVSPLNERDEIDYKNRFFIYTHSKGSTVGNFSEPVPVLPLFVASKAEFVSKLPRPTRVILNLE